MTRHFARDLPARIFLRNTLAVSLAALALAVALYALLVPGLAGMLAGGGDPLGRFLRQVLTNGLPVVFTVNYVSFVLLAGLDRPGGVAPGWVPVLDIALRAGLFVALHALIYLVSVDLFGAFGGRHGTALRVVGPTLAAAAGWGNISGAYLYATGISALPLYAAAARRSARMARLVAWVPWGVGPALLALAFFGIFVATVTLIARALSL